MRRGRGGRGGGRGRCRMNRGGGLYPASNGYSFFERYLGIFNPANWSLFATGQAVDSLRRKPGVLQSAIPPVNRRMPESETHFSGEPNTYDNKIAGKARAVKAYVNRDVCTGCGVCAEECPNRAITVREIARVDANTCTGCGVCVEACPSGALSLGQQGRKRR